MIEIIRDDSYDNISNSRIFKYVQIAVFCKHTTGTWRTTYIYIYDLSLCVFVYCNLQGDCPPALKKYFVKRNTPQNTRQTGQLDYCHARIELGTSRVQYHAAKLWNHLNHRYNSIPCIYEFKKTLSENIITGCDD